MKYKHKHIDKYDRIFISQEITTEFALTSFGFDITLLHIKVLNKYKLVLFGRVIRIMRKWTSHYQSSPICLYIICLYYV